VLVVQRHLGADSLAEWLRGQGWSVNRLRSRMSYRLLEVSRPVDEAVGSEVGP
jgi:16S rRNA (guanine1207-N2)-methyltransferase